MGEVNDKSDIQLLRDYAERHDEAAFREIVTRHTDFVYSAAIRQVLASDVAADVAQSVFVDLARKAQALADDGILPRASLAGWLHRATRFAALNQLRDARRRVTNERQAMQQLLTDSESSPGDWEQIRPLLDEALETLGDDDREALLLRYFKNQNFRDVGLALGISDDTAQKRVSRAVERLREFFSKRNVTVGAGGLVVLISANAVQAAPMALAATISAAALSTAAVSTSTVLAATKTIAMTTFQKAIVTATIAVIAAAGVYKARQAAQLREQIQTLQQQQAPLTDQIKQLELDRDEAARQMASLRDDNERLKSDTADLLKMRAEVARLRSVSADTAKSQSLGTPAEQKADDDAWVRRIKLLKQRIQQSPDANMPELTFLDESDWLEAARGKLDSEADFQKAISDVRRRAQSRFMDEIGKALQKYLAADNNQFPADISQLTPFFKDPPAEGLLERYQIEPAGNQPLSGISDTNGWVITPKVQENGSFVALRPNGGVTQSVDSPEMRVLAPAIKAMLDASPVINGRRSPDIHQLEPYLTTPEQRAAYERLTHRGGSATN